MRKQRKKEHPCLVVCTNVGKEDVKEGKGKGMGENINSIVEERE